MVAFETFCDSLPNYQQQLQRGLDLGLIEVSPAPKKEDRVYRIPRILPHIIPKIKRPETPEFYSLYRKAHDKLHELWGNEQNRSEEKWRGIFKLLFADKYNPDRFRQGFSQMLSVQYNAKADKALESELRQLKDELSKENFCYQLEDYLRQGDWRKADEETAWLFYKVMVLQEYRNWTDLFDNFPNSILQELDRLWVTSSHGNFGFSVQKRIWTDIGGNLNPDNERWDSYGEQIGWYRSNELWNSWEGYNASSFTLESQGNLPALPYIRGELKSLPWDSSNEGLNSFLAKYYGRNTFQLCARTDLMKEGEEVVLMAGWMGWWHLFFHNKI